MTIGSSADESITDDLIFNMELHAQNAENGLSPKW